MLVASAPLVLAKSGSTTAALIVGFGALMLAGVGIGMWIALRRREREP